MAKIQLFTGVSPSQIIHLRKGGQAALSTPTFAREVRSVRRGPSSLSPFFKSCQDTRDSNGAARRSIIRSGDVRRTFSLGSPGLLRCQPAGAARYRLYLPAAGDPAPKGPAG